MTTLDPKPSWWRRRFLGTGEYVHWSLRVLANPVFELVILLGLVVEFAGHGGSGWSVWKTVGLVLIGLSLTAEIVNAVVLRRRRRAAARP